MSVDVSPNALARCATHPDELASATCQRCGAFVCGACTTWLLGSLYCPACATRPEVNYLETLRLQFWGKRDATAWFVMFCALLSLIGAQAAFREGNVPACVSMVAVTAVGVCFFLGMRWARYALLLVPTLFILPGLSEMGPLLVVFAIVPTLFMLQIFLDPRSRLFFRVKVPERALRRLWDIRVNNPLARHAVSLGVLAFFFPLFAPAAVVCGAIALRRVDPHARPPIGRRASSVVGIVLGMGATAMWVMVIARAIESGGLGWLTSP
ncbi:hypothetical protein JY651_40840 [Pyxidicoccus parkwayensis]|uniref:B box-type domain-containing protein n=1 Tax=Pyxidicoccus parkwayensis TaxID=2813578 RepID=A0ABX7NRR8_9BACT|nr:hypothetical protein [Pyxidicoccus parkwaysis]QSQ21470.1 hypothetical protein JY651_40840 [Pyxidicoccus parkwaysis]